MNILEMLFIESLVALAKDEEEKTEKKTEKDKLSSCYGECAKENNKKPEPENPVEVCIYRDSMIVTFNDVDRHQIQEFILVLDANPCKYTQEENEFEITANETTLYLILLYLTDEYEEIALY